MSVCLGLINRSLAGFMLYVPRGYPQSQRGEEFCCCWLEILSRGDLVRVNPEQLERLTVLFSFLP